MTTVVRIKDKLYADTKVVDNTNTGGVVIHKTMTKLLPYLGKPFVYEGTIIEVVVMTGNLGRFGDFMCLIERLTDDIIKLTPEVEIPDLTGVLKSVAAVFCRINMDRSFAFVMGGPDITDSNLVRYWELDPGMRRVREFKENCVSGSGASAVQELLELSGESEIKEEHLPFVHKHDPYTGEAFDVYDPKTKTISSLFDGIDPVSKDSLRFRTMGVCLANAAIKQYAPWSDVELLPIKTKSKAVKRARARKVVK